MSDDNWILQKEANRLGYLLQTFKTPSPGRGLNRLRKFWEHLKNELHVLEMFIVCLGILISKGGGQKDQNDPSKVFKLYFAIPLRVKIQASPFYRTGCIRMVAISRSRGERAAMYSLKKKRWCNIPHYPLTSYSRTIISDCEKTPENTVMFLMFSGGNNAIIHANDAAAKFNRGPAILAFRTQILSPWVAPISALPSACSPQKLQDSPACNESPTISHKFLPSSHQQLLFFKVTIHAVWLWSFSITL